MEERRLCFNCRYEDRSPREWPCRECIELIDDYKRDYLADSPRCWEPKEAENEEKKEERLCCDCEYYKEPRDGEHCKNCGEAYAFRWEPVEMEERTCDNCRYYERKRDKNPCRNCSNSYHSMWKQAQEPAAKDTGAGIQMKG